VGLVQARRYDERRRGVRQARRLDLLAGQEIGASGRAGLSGAADWLQYEISTGTLMLPSSVRVAPPISASRNRECPNPPVRSPVSLRIRGRPLRALFSLSNAGLSTPRAVIRVKSVQKFVMERRLQQPVSAWKDEW
jgi:hypothetical protein